ncbi:MAG TPA: penicillin-binding protein [Candidatus Faecisoma merdavium]|nr:penicillin-binding protein [Candidatus Faecisoma merdavium]
MKTRTNKWKSPMIAFCFFLVFIFVLYLQYLYLSLSSNVYGINMQEFANNRNTYSSTLYAKRGTIYDVQGDILATDVSSYTVIAYLDESRTGSSSTLYHVQDKQKTAEALSPLLNMDVDTLLELLNKDAYQVELGPGGRGISEVLKKQIEELNLPGIDFIESYKRFYPNGDFASYLIGYAKKNEVMVDDKLENVMQGELGIEVKYDDILKGTNGYISYQQDRYGYKIPDTPEENVPAIDGSDIYLTIDANIQRILEAEADKIVESYDPEWLTVTIMDAKTGDILGSVSEPSFDPNILNITNYENPLTSFVYEPGSVMKIFTYMCAIEKGTYVGNQTYMSGNIDIEGTKIYDWNKYGWGEITYDHGFEMSSNVGTVNMMQNFLTKDDLKQCLTSYGFGSPTNIELPRELSGSLVFNYPVEVAAASYGQGITATPIQQLQALSIIANNGHMLKPNIISKIVKDGEVTYERQVTKSDRIVSEQTVEKIKELMYNAVNNVEGGAIGTAYIVDGLDVIGKTGTAEIADLENGGYLTGWLDSIYSFSGMFPKDDPEIIIFASIKRPNNGSNIGLKTMSNAIMESIGKYLGLIGGDSIDTNKSFQIGSYINLNTNDVKESLENKGLDVIVLGNGDRIINQYPINTTLLQGDKIFLLTNDSNIKMPSLIGYTKIECISLLNLLNVDYEFEGYGYVTEQSIKVGESINDKIKIILKERQ